MALRSCRHPTRAMEGCSFPTASALSLSLTVQAMRDILRSTTMATFTSSSALQTRTAAVTSPCATLPETERPTSWFVLEAWMNEETDTAQEWSSTTAICTSARQLTCTETN